MGSPIPLESLGPAPTAASPAWMNTASPGSPLAPVDLLGTLRMPGAWQGLVVPVLGDSWEEAASEVWSPCSVSETLRPMEHSHETEIFARTVSYPSVCFMRPALERKDSGIKCLYLLCPSLLPWPPLRPPPEAVIYFAASNRELHPKCSAGPLCFKSLGSRSSQLQAGLFPVNGKCFSYTVTLETKPRRL